MENKDSKDKECLCFNCIYGGQPYGYFPIVCVHGKRVKDMYHEVFKCKHFEKCPDFTEEEKQEAWKYIINEEL